jgi:outer membrane protein assembly factor BamE (lipoprotein component of BamABCDE complex)
MRRHGRRWSGPAVLALAPALWLALLTGCAFSRANLGDALNDEDIRAIEKGRSTRAEVTTRLGAPDRIIEANGHEILHYYRYDLKAGSLLLILLNFSRVTIKSDDLYVLVNREGVVDEVVFGRRTDRMEFQWWPFGD